MPQTQQISKLAIKNVGPALRAHLVTAWFVFGGFILYTACFLPLHRLVDLITLKSLLAFAAMLVFLPVLIVGCGVGFAVSLVEQHKYGLLFAGIAAVVAYLILWFGVWCAMYGRRGLFTCPTSRTQKSRKTKA